MKNHIASLDVGVVSEEFFQATLKGLCERMSGDIVRTEDDVIWIEGKRGRCKFHHCETLPKEEKK